MQRLVFSRQVPMTYGSSWAPLFCAPVLGALAAWAGLMMISLLKAAGVPQLSTLATELPDLRSPTAGVLWRGGYPWPLRALPEPAREAGREDALQRRPGAAIQGPASGPPEVGRPASGAALQ
jgi:hypothetical protein